MIQLASRRCRYILKDADECPGDIDECQPCKNSIEYQTDRDTIVPVQFQPARPLVVNEELS